MNVLFITLVGAGLLSSSMCQSGIAADQALSQEAGSSETPTNGLDKLEALYVERSKLSTIQLTFKINYQLFHNDKAMEGVVRQYRIWYVEGPGEKMRIEYKDLEFPNDPKRKANSKFAQCDGISRIISHADNPEVLVEEISAEYENVTHKIADQKRSIDPRLMGLFPAPVEGLRNYSLDMLQTLEPTTQYADGNTNVLSDANTSRFIYSTKAGARVAYYFRKNHTAPTEIASKITAHNGDVYQMQMQIEYMRYDNKLGGPIEFPRTIKFVSWTNGVKHREETVTVQDAIFNHTISDESFSWSALQPAHGARLIKNEVYHDLRGWDGTDFTLPPEDVARTKAGPSRSRTRLISILMILTGLPLLVLALVSAVNRWRKPIHKTQ